MSAALRSLAILLIVVLCTNTMVRAQSVTTPAANPGEGVIEHGGGPSPEREAFRYRFNEAMNLCRAATDEHNFEKARQALQIARDIPNEEPTLWTPAETSEFNARLANAQADLDRSKAQFDPTADRQISGPAAAQSSAGSEKLPTTQESPAEAAAHAALDRRLPEVNFNNNPFVDVIDFLRDVTGTNIVANWNSLEKAGIDKNTPVTLRLKDVKFGTALQLIVTGLGDGDRKKAAYGVLDGVITISTPDDLPKNVITPTSTEALAREKELEARIAHLENQLSESHGLVEQLQQQNAALYEKLQQAHQTQPAAK